MNNQNAGNITSIQQDIDNKNNLISLEEYKIKNPVPINNFVKKVDDASDIVRKKIASLTEAEFNEKFKDSFLFAGTHTTFAQKQKYIVDLLTNAHTLKYNTIKALVDNDVVKTKYINLGVTQLDQNHANAPTAEQQKVAATKILLLDTVFAKEVDFIDKIVTLKTALIAPVPVAGQPDNRKTKKQILTMINEILSLYPNNLVNTTGLTDLITNLKTSKTQIEELNADAKNVIYDNNVPAQNLNLVAAAITDNMAPIPAVVGVGHADSLKTKLNTVVNDLAVVPQNILNTALQANAALAAANAARADRHALAAAQAAQVAAQNAQVGAQNAVVNARNQFNVVKITAEFTKINEKVAGIEDINIDGIDADKAEKDSAEGEFATNLSKFETFTDNDYQKLLDDVNGQVIPPFLYAFNADGALSFNEGKFNDCKKQIIEAAVNARYKKVMNDIKFSESEVEYAQKLANLLDLQKNAVSVFPEKYSNQKVNAFKKLQIGQDESEENENKQSEYSNSDVAEALTALSNANNNFLVKQQGVSNDIDNNINTTINEANAANFIDRINLFLKNNASFQQALSGFTTANFGIAAPANNEFNNLFANNNNVVQINNGDDFAARKQKIATFVKYFVLNQNDSHLQNNFAEKILQNAGKPLVDKTKIAIEITQSVASLKNILNFDSIIKPQIETTKQTQLRDANKAVKFAKTIAAKSPHFANPFDGVDEMTEEFDDFNNNEVTITGKDFDLNANIAVADLSIADNFLQDEKDERMEFVGKLEDLIADINNKPEYYIAILRQYYDILNQQLPIIQRMLLNNTININALARAEDALNNIFNNDGIDINLKTKIKNFKESVATFKQEHCKIEPAKSALDLTDANIAYADGVNNAALTNFEKLYILKNTRPDQYEIKRVLITGEDHNKQAKFDQQVEAFGKCSYTVAANGVITMQKRNTLTFADYKEYKNSNLTTEQKNAASNILNANKNTVKQFASDVLKTVAPNEIGQDAFVATINTALSGYYEANTNIETSISPVIGGENFYGKITEAFNAYKTTQSGVSENNKKIYNNFAKAVGLIKKYNELITTVNGLAPITSLLKQARFELLLLIQNGMITDPQFEKFYEKQHEAFSYLAKNAHLVAFNGVLAGNAEAIRRMAAKVNASVNKINALQTEIVDNDGLLEDEKLVINTDQQLRNKVYAQLKGKPIDAIKAKIKQDVESNANKNASPDMEIVKNNFRKLFDISNVNIDVKLDLKKVGDGFTTHKNAAKNLSNNNALIAYMLLDNTNGDKKTIDKKAIVKQIFSLKDAQTKEIDQAIKILQAAKEKFIKKLDGDNDKERYRTFIDSFQKEPNKIYDFLYGEITQGENKALHDVIKNNLTQSKTEPFNAANQFNNTNPFNVNANQFITNDLLNQYFNINRSNPLIAAEIALLNQTICKMYGLDIVSDIALVTAIREGLENERNSDKMQVQLLIPAMGRAAAIAGNPTFNADKAANYIKANPDRFNLLNVYFNINRANPAALTPAEIALLNQTICKMYGLNIVNDIALVDEIREGLEVVRNSDKMQVGAGGAAAFNADTAASYIKTNTDHFNLLNVYFNIDAQYPLSQVQIKLLNKTICKMYGLDIYKDIALIDEIRGELEAKRQNLMQEVDRDQAVVDAQAALVAANAVVPVVPANVVAAQAKLEKTKADAFAAQIKTNEEDLKNIAAGKANKNFGKVPNSSFEQLASGGEIKQKFISDVDFTAALAAARAAAAPHALTLQIPANTIPGINRALNLRVNIAGLNNEQIESLKHGIQTDLLYVFYAINTAGAFVADERRAIIQKMYGYNLGDAKIDEAIEALQNFYLAANNNKTLKLFQGLDEHGAQNDTVNWPLALQVLGDKQQREMVRSFGNNNIANMWGLLANQPAEFRFDPAHPAINQGGALQINVNQIPGINVGLNIVAPSVAVNEVISLKQKFNSDLLYIYFSVNRVVNIVRPAGILINFRSQARINAELNKLIAKMYGLRIAAAGAPPVNLQYDQAKIDEIRTELEKHHANIVNNAAAGLLAGSMAWNGNQNNYIEAHRQEFLNYKNYNKSHLKNTAINTNDATFAANRPFVIEAANSKTLGVVNNAGAGVALNLSIPAGITNDDLHDLKQKIQQNLFYSYFLVVRDNINTKKQATAIIGAIYGLKPGVAAVAAVPGGRAAVPAQQNDQAKIDAIFAALEAQRANLVHPAGQPHVGSIDFKKLDGYIENVLNTKCSFNINNTADKNDRIELFIERDKKTDKASEEQMEAVRSNVLYSYFLVNKNQDANKIQKDQRLAAAKAFGINILPLPGTDEFNKLGVPQTLPNGATEADYVKVKQALQSQIEKNLEAVDRICDRLNMTAIEKKFYATHTIGDAANNIKVVKPNFESIKNDIENNKQFYDQIYNTKQVFLPTDLFTNKTQIAKTSDLFKINYDTNAWAAGAQEMIAANAIPNLVEQGGNPIALNLQIPAGIVGEELNDLKQKASKDLLALYFLVNRAVVGGRTQVIINNELNAIIVKMYGLANSRFLIRKIREKLEGMRNSDMMEGNPAVFNWNKASAYMEANRKTLENPIDIMDEYFTYATTNRGVDDIKNNLIAKMYGLKVVDGVAPAAQNDQAKIDAIRAKLDDILIKKGGAAPANGVANAANINTTRLNKVKTYIATEAGKKALIFNGIEPNTKLQSIQTKQKVGLDVDDFVERLNPANTARINAGVTGYANLFIKTDADATRKVKIVNLVAKNNLALYYQLHDADVAVNAEIPEYNLAKAQNSVIKNIFGVTTQQDIEAIKTALVNLKAKYVKPQVPANADNELEQFEAMLNNRAFYYDLFAEVKSIQSIQDKIKQMAKDSENTPENYSAKMFQAVFGDKSNILQNYQKNNKQADEIVKNVDNIEADVSNQLKSDLIKESVNKIEGLQKELAIDDNSSNPSKVSINHDDKNIELGKRLIPTLNEELLQQKQLQVQSDYDESNKALKIREEMNKNTGDTEQQIAVLNTVNSKNETQITQIKQQYGGNDATVNTIQQAIDSKLAEYKTGFGKGESYKFVNVTYDENGKMSVKMKPEYGGDMWSAAKNTMSLNRDFNIGTGSLSVIAIQKLIVKEYLLEQINVDSANSEKYKNAIDNLRKVKFVPVWNDDAITSVLKQAKDKNGEEVLKSLQKECNNNYEAFKKEIPLIQVALNKNNAGLVYLVIGIALTLAMVAFVTILRKLYVMDLLMKLFKGDLTYINTSEINIRGDGAITKDFSNKNILSNYDSTFNDSVESGSFKSYEDYGLNGTVKGSPKPDVDSKITNYNIDLIKKQDIDIKNGNFVMKDASGNELYNTSLQQVGGVYNQETGLIELKMGAGTTSARTITIDPSLDFDLTKLDENNIDQYYQNLEGQNELIARQINAEKSKITIMEKELFNANGLTGTSKTKTLTDLLTKNKLLLEKHGLSTDYSRIEAGDRNFYREQTLKTLLRKEKEGVNDMLQTQYLLNKQQVAVGDAKAKIDEVNAVFEQNKGNLEAFLQPQKDKYDAIVYSTFSAGIVASFAKYASDRKKQQNISELDKIHNNNDKIKNVSLKEAAFLKTAKEEDLDIYKAINFAKNPDNKISEDTLKRLKTSNNANVEIKMSESVLKNLSQEDKNNISNVYSNIKDTFEKDKALKEADKNKENNLQQINLNLNINGNKVDVAKNGDKLDLTRKETETDIKTINKTSQGIFEKDYVDLTDKQKQLIAAVISGKFNDKQFTDFEFVGELEIEEQNSILMTQKGIHTSYINNVIDKLVKNETFNQYVKNAISESVVDDNNKASHFETVMFGNKNNEETKLLRKNIVEKLSNVELKADDESAEFVIAKYDITTNPWNNLKKTLNTDDKGFVAFLNKYLANGVEKNEDYWKEQVKKTSFVDLVIKTAISKKLIGNSQSIVDDYKTMKTLNTAIGKKLLSQAILNNKDPLKTLYLLRKVNTNQNIINKINEENDKGYKDIENALKSNEPTGVERTANLLFNANVGMANAYNEEGDFVKKALSKFANYLTNGYNCLADRQVDNNSSTAKKVGGLIAGFFARIFVLPFNILFSLPKLFGLKNPFDKSDAYLFAKNKRNQSPDITIEDIKKSYEELRNNQIIAVNKNLPFNQYQKKIESVAKELKRITKNDLEVTSLDKINAVFFGAKVGYDAKWYRPVGFGYNTIDKAIHWDKNRIPLISILVDPIIWAVRWTSKIALALLQVVSLILKPFIRLTSSAITSLANITNRTVERAVSIVTGTPYIQPMEIRPLGSLSLEVEEARKQWTEKGSEYLKKDNANGVSAKTEFLENFKDSFKAKSLQGDFSNSKYDNVSSVNEISKLIKQNNEKIKEGISLNKTNQRMNKYLERDPVSEGINNNLISEANNSQVKILNKIANKVNKNLSTNLQKSDQINKVVR